MKKFEKIAELMDFQALGFAQQFNQGRYPVNGYAIPLSDGFFMLNENYKYYLAKEKKAKNGLATIAK